MVAKWHATDLQCCTVEAQSASGFTDVKNIRDIRSETCDHLLLVLYVLYIEVDLHVP